MTTTKQKYRLLVSGYIREETTTFEFFMNTKIPKDIIDLIYIFYPKGLQFDSEIIIDDGEKMIFGELLQEQFDSNNEYKKFNKTNLLYRSTTNENTADAFHKACDGKSNTITIIHSNYNHIFGAFTEAEWSRDGFKKDKRAFLFLLRSQFTNNPKIILYKNIEIDYIEAVKCYSNYGPRFGGKGSLHADISIKPPGNNIFTYSHSNRFKFIGNELCGGKIFQTLPKDHVFEVKCYEVFQLLIAE